MPKEPLKIIPAAVPLGQSCVVLDVRTEAEHREIALKEAHQHIPLDKLDAVKFMQENKIDASRPVYILCRSGKRATQAAEAFIAAGHDNVHVVEGGILAVEAAGIPVHKGKVMSLERQVRIAAGALVVTGTLLGAFLSPWFYALAGFVGAGLVFAGVTDTCTMGLLLAKAPWNKRLTKESCSASACTTAPVTSQCSVVTKTAEIKMPAGNAFYSPAGSTVTATSQPASRAAKSSTGGCS